MAIKSTLLISAINENIFATAEAFKTLMKYQVLDVQRINENVITSA